MRAPPLAFLVFLALQLGPTESPAQARRLVPVGDYHTHLMSESAARLLVVPSSEPSFERIVRPRPARQRSRLTG